MEVDDTDSGIEKFVNVPDSVELMICHQKQNYNWDCGISCLQMVLPLELREDLNANFHSICQDEGFNKSVWTIDLCYLLQRYKVKHRFCTITIGIHPGYEAQSFYSKVIRKDEKRVTQKFREAEERGIEIQKTSLNFTDLVLHLALNGPIILLTNSSLLTCDSCKTRKLLTELRHWIPCSVSYNGHYIVLCGYNLSKKRFLYRNPTYQDRVCSMSFSAMDDARRSYGTDEDTILIYSNIFNKKQL